MRCIVCLSDKPQEAFNSEHVIPEAIGGTLRIDRVCGECNNRLARLADSPLSNNWLVLVQRHLLGIGGKSNNAPSPLRSGNLVAAGNQKVHLSLSDSGEPMGCLLVPQIEYSDDKASRSALVSVDATEKEQLPRIVNKILARNGLPVLSAEAVEVLALEQVIEHPQVATNVTVDVTHYKRGLLKICYELCWYWLGEAYLQEPLSQALRDAITDEDKEADWINKHKLEAEIGLVGATPRLNMWDEEPASHIALLVCSRGKLVFYVRVFQTFEARIKVSNSARAFEGFRSKFLAIGPINGTRRESSLEEEISRLNASDQGSNPISGDDD